MNNHPRLPQNRADDADDLFAPERVDETIAARLAPDAPEDDAATLVRDLAAAHALPAAADDALRRVRARLAATPLTGADASQQSLATIEGIAPVPPSAPAPRRADMPHPRMDATWRALAAVLVVGLLAGSFLAVLRLRAGESTANAAWQNAGITAARARGAALDFDPTKGVTYAVSDAAPGAIYACGSNHIWVSQDAGQTYRPFTPALPSDDTQNCAIATVPGASGLFSLIPDPQAHGALGAAQVVGYTLPGAAQWQVLRIPSTIQAFGTDVSAAVAPDELWTQIANNPFGDQVRAVGNWLVLLLPAPGAVGGPLYPIGTPDFGRTWTWLGLQLHLLCSGLYTDPTTPTHLFCAGKPEGANGLGDIYETRDGGKSWTDTDLAAALPPPDASTPRVGYHFVPGADTQMVYVTAPPLQLMRRPLAGGSWQGVTAFTVVTTTLLVGALPDDSAYAVTGTQRQLQVLRIAPGTKAAEAYGPALTLPTQNDAVSFALGDIWPGGQPALYVRATNQPSTYALWRLALAPLASRTPVDTTPLPTWAAATLTTAPTCPSGAAGNLSAIQPGGLGADISTFAARWGPSRGVAAGTVSFGHYADSGTPVIGAASPASNGRVFALSYTVDSTQQMSLDQALALARTIVPTDAAPEGQPQSIVASTTVAVVLYFCSSAFAAAFPAGTQSIAPLTSSGLIAVTEYLRGDGTVDRIDLRAYGA